MNDTPMLHGVMPSVCNVQQSPLKRATSHATPLQHESLKALARRALTCNEACNAPATPRPETVQQVEVKAGAIRRTPVARHASRAHLLALAETEYLDAVLVRALPGPELAAIAEQLAGYDADKLREALCVYLRTLAEDAVMRAGKLPPAYDTPAMCRHCGPIWLPRAQVAMLDVMDGSPTCWGCPWCFIHPSKGMDIPRPKR